MTDAVETASRVIALARELGVTIAVAESCTGGLIGGDLTAVSGSSAVFLGGVIAYHNSVKRNLLGVPEDIFVSHGAVSEPCARAMADGVRRTTGADMAVSVTGIAGPGGGSTAKPVGTVYIGYSGFGGTRAERHHFGGDREAVRRATVEMALGELHRILEMQARDVG